MNKRITAAAALLAAGMLALAGCSGDGGSGSGSSDPIVVGSVNTISGPATFPEASQAAKAVFDKFNADGGLNGRKIDYKALDDKGDPATATANAREIVGSDNAVAMIGSASLIECDLNKKYYEQEGILSIPGIGVDTGCFDSKAISPANVGPYNDMTLTLLYGSEQLKLDNICVLLEIAGSTRPTYQAAIDKWTQITGKKPLYVDDTVPYGASDYTPYIVKAKQAGCKALAINPVEPDAIGQVKAANAQGWNDVTWLYLTSVYSENFAKAIDNAGAGIYVPAEFYPFTEENDVNKDWRDLMTKNNIPLTSFSQGGYLAATYFIEALKSVKGDITRESVSAAIKSMPAVQNKMIGDPYKFGTIPTAGWPIELKSGTHAWQKIADDWYRIPKK
ncbi:ABC transporter substrate-binding protein [Microbacterium sp. NPDC089698]|jgi:branched-chain amino acid transport system substrate-binding protein|uniref:ABC transporter substrate-binding protein n=1 Tax=unclassified Microbacterium TaxID=2609290 RepID=UPI002838BFB1|nr:ABC transporter substrate-binding protein [Microbacterium sp.]MDR2320096.1 ABC transporter substrate-binding protein [Microbacterium sp.]